MVPRKPPLIKDRISNWLTRVSRRNVGGLKTSDREGQEERRGHREVLLDFWFMKNEKESELMALLVYLRLIMLLSQFLTPEMLLVQAKFR